VKVVLDHLGECRSVYAAAQAIGSKVGVGPQMLRKWVIQAQLDAQHSPRVATTEQQRIKQLERKNRDLKESDEALLRFSSRGNSTSSLLICSFIDQMRAPN